VLFFLPSALSKAPMMFKTTRADQAPTLTARRPAGATFQTSLRLWQAKYKAQKTPQPTAKSRVADENHSNLAVIPDGS
jgi:hypothetical protein